MSKEMRQYIDTFKQRLLKENEDFNVNDTTEYLDCLSCLKKVSNGINRQEVILWFNENNIQKYKQATVAEEVNQSKTLGAARFIGRVPALPQKQK